MVTFLTADMVMPLLTMILDLSCGCALVSSNPFEWIIDS